MQSDQPSSPPDQSFEDPTVLNKERRPDEKAYTVINRYFPGGYDVQSKLVPTFVKIQCMHCADPACASACIVGALSKNENGAVSYDVTKCIMPLLHGGLSLRDSRV
ncbi:MAG: 4Fe-4S dicluster domain-containing protein [Desulfobacteraceae bacterium]